MPQDKETAIKYLEKAANQNHAPAMYQLGVLYSPLDETQVAISSFSVVASGY